MNESDLPFFIFFGVMSALCVFGIIYERYEWNGGVCRKTNKPWVQFDINSQGGRGYKSGNVYTWISWPVDGDSRTAHDDVP
jgi:hypothetical protein